MSCSSEVSSQWRGGKDNKVWRERSPLKVMLKELRGIGGGFHRGEKREREGEGGCGERQRERKNFPLALLFYWPSPAGDWLHFSLSTASLRGFLSSVKKQHFLSRQILSCWVLKTALSAWNPLGDKHLNSSRVLPRLVLIDLGETCVSASYTCLHFTSLLLSMSGIFFFFST